MESENNLTGPDIIELLKSDRYIEDLPISFIDKLPKDLQEKYWKYINNVRKLNKEISSERLSELQSGICSHLYINKWVDGFNLICTKCGHKKSGNVKKD